MADRRITDVDYAESLASNESFFINQNNTLKQINKSNVVFSISNGGTGATTADEARANLGAISMKSGSIILAQGDWYLGDDDLYHNDENDGNCAGVTAESIVFVAPATDINSFNLYGKHGVRCVSQGFESLFFIANTDPIDDITVNYAVLA